MTEEDVEDLDRRLRQFPAARQRVRELVEMMEDCEGDLVKADAAEARTREVLRELGREALQAWANRQVEKATAEHRAQDEPGVVEE
jgi:hypothetical protein